MTSMQRREFEIEFCVERLDFSSSALPSPSLFNVVLSSRRPPRLPRGQGRDEQSRHEFYDSSSR